MKKAEIPQSALDSWERGVGSVRTSDDLVVVIFLMNNNNKKKKTTIMNGFLFNFLL